MLLLAFSLLSFVRFQSSLNIHGVKSKKPNDIIDFQSKLFRDIENENRLLREIEKLQEKISTERYIEELKELKRAKRNLTKEVGRLPSNFHKNCVLKTMPFDFNRVILLKNDNSSDFINANFVDGFNQKNKFIVTQGK
jgi:hypothetical protein